MRLNDNYLVGNRHTRTETSISQTVPKFESETKTTF